MNNGHHDIRIAEDSCPRKPADQFQANPQNWRTHPQSQRDALAGVLVFYKGAPNDIAAHFGEIDVGEWEDTDATPV